MRWTISFAAVSLLGLTMQAQALDATPDTTRIVSDPLYLPAQGQFYGATSWNWSSANQDTFDASGAHTGSSQITGNAISSCPMTVPFAEESAPKASTTKPPRAKARPVVTAAVSNQVPE